MWDNFLALLDEDLNEEENSIAQLSLNLISSRLSSEVTVAALYGWHTVKPASKNLHFSKLAQTSCYRNGN